jgi:hypothetical protein
MVNSRMTPHLRRDSIGGHHPDLSLVRRRQEGGRRPAGKLRPGMEVRHDGGSGRLADPALYASRLHHPSTSK